MLIITCTSFEACTHAEKVLLDPQARRPPACWPLPAATALNLVYWAAAMGCTGERVSAEGQGLRVQREKGCFFWQVLVHQISSPCQYLHTLSETDCKERRRFGEAAALRRWRTKCHKSQGFRMVLPQTRAYLLSRAMTLIPGQQGHITVCSTKEQKN